MNSKITSLLLRSLPNSSFSSKTLCSSKLNILRICFLCSSRRQIIIICRVFPGNTVSTFPTWEGNTKIAVSNIRLVGTLPGHVLPNTVIEVRSVWYFYRSTFFIHTVFSDNVLSKIGLNLDSSIFFKGSFFFMHSIFEILYSYRPTILQIL